MTTKLRENQILMKNELVSRLIQHTHKVFNVKVSDILSYEIIEKPSVIEIDINNVPKGFLLDRNLINMIIDVNTQVFVFAWQYVYVTNG